MSYSTVVGIYSNGDCVELQELRNSHGTCPSVWGRLLINRGHDENWLHDNEPLEALWGDVENLSDWQAIPLVLTFDTGVVPRDAFLESAEAIREFERRLPEQPQRVNHWPAIADALEDAVMDDYDYLGIYGTSIVDFPYEKWDEVTDERIPLPLGDLYILNRHLKYLTDEDRGRYYAANPDSSGKF